VIRAADGLEAVERAREAMAADGIGFSLILMDLRMPRVDGLEATRRIRQELGLTRLPIIALTAAVMAEEQQAARDAGVTDFMGKPMDLNRLAEMIWKYCPYLD
jgi:CheY-like chemotaxis protein